MAEFERQLSAVGVRLATVTTTRPCREGCDPLRTVSPI